VNDSALSSIQCLDTVGWVWKKSIQPVSACSVSIPDSFPVEDLAQPVEGRSRQRLDDDQNAG